MLRTEASTRWVGPAADAWNSVLARMSGDVDPMLSAGYHALHDIAGDGVASALAVDDALFVPGLRVPIPGTGHDDLQSCNGYGGPVANGLAGGRLDLAWGEWRAAAREAGIVAAFFRLNPLLDNRAALPSDAEVRADREVVAVDLRSGAPEAWARATSRHRNMVNRARRAGVDVRWDSPDDWRDFPPLYDAAMERLGAPARLRYRGDYFDALRALPFAHIAALRDHDGVIAAAVFLIGARHAYYHVAARRPDAANFSGNFLIHAGIERAAESGAQALLLGGGATTASDDALLGFKRSVSPWLLRFQTARVIADPDAFASLCARHFAPSRGWLLPYREPVPEGA